MGMATLRQIRCTVCFGLLLVGAMLLLFGHLPRHMVEDRNPGSSSLTQTFQLGVLHGDEHVMLLKPMKDESRYIKAVFAPVASSKMGSQSQNVQKKRRLPIKPLKVLDPRASLDAGMHAVSLLDSKMPSEHVVRALSSQKELDKELVKSTEGIEEQYFKAAQPVVESKSRHQKVHIVIVTNRRSGSSFLGQFFNQHPSVFFQFEPLKLTEQKREFYPDIADYLRHLVKCEFDKTPYLAEFYNSEPLHRGRSRVMVTSPLCNLSSHQQLSLAKVKKCKPLEQFSLMQACRNKQYQVAKFIRLYSISTLEPLAFDPDINLKIIHLVRDPRGTYISRSKVPNAKTTLELGQLLDKDISYICRRINQNLNFVRSQPAWLQGKYKLVRYEDIAHNPEKLAQEVYDFAGLGQLPDAIHEWIQNNTKGVFRPPGNANTYYSTSRNASEVSEAWRYTVPLEVVLRMQRFCGETLRDLGYLQIQTIKELSDKSKSLVAELPNSGKPSL